MASSDGSCRGREGRPPVTSPAQAGVIPSAEARNRTVAVPRSRDQSAQTSKDLRRLTCLRQAPGRRQATAATSETGWSRVRRSERHEGGEAAVGHTLAVHDGLGDLAHGAKSRVSHDLLVCRIPVLPRLEDRIGENHDLVWAGSGQLRKRHHVWRLHVIGHALTILKRTVVPPDPAGLRGQLLIGCEFGLRDGEDESVNVLAHGVLLDLKATRDHSDPA